MSLLAIDFAGSLLPWAWPVGLAVLTVGGSIAVRKIASSRPSGQRVAMQLTVLAVSAVGLLAVVLTLPVDLAIRGELLGFLGIVASASIALSSTTILGNGLAGMMLRLVRDFGVGDFVKIEGVWGRVTERGIIHTEIQTEDRDLTTLPNLYLVSHPLTFIRQSGTILSTQVSLGYDISRHDVERALLAGAEGMGLKHPFVQVLELRDFSVVYRIAGLLEDVQAVVSTRSKLNAAVLDSLHEAGIEIVSPTFMNTRSVEGQRIIPKWAASGPESESASPESVIFDKADDVSALAALESKLGEAKDLLAATGKTDPEREEALKALEKMEAEIEVRRERLEDED